MTNEDITQLADLDPGIKFDSLKQEPDTRKIYIPFTDTLTVIDGE